MGVSGTRSSKIFNPLRLFGRGKTQDRQSSKNKKAVHFDLDNTSFCSYPGPDPEERDLVYPNITEEDTLQEFRNRVRNGYTKGSAKFKDAVEKLYTGARKNYSEAELSSGEFSLASAQDDEHVYKVVASEIRGLEELYCSVIVEHREWAVRRIVDSQRDQSLRRQLPEIAATVSTRSKNFARLLALGDAEEASEV